jgi:hypothetical protein
MEKMSFDDLDLLLRVIEIWVVLHILVHGLHDEFISYSPCFLFYGLDHCSYGVGSKERGFMSMHWLRPMFALSWCSFPM